MPDKKGNSFARIASRNKGHNFFLPREEGEARMSGRYMPLLSFLFREKPSHFLLCFQAQDTNLRKLAYAGSLGRLNHHHGRAPLNHHAATLGASNIALRTAV